MRETATTVDQASTTDGRTRRARARAAISRRVRALRASLTADHVDQARPPRWPRYAVLCALLPAGIVGALVLSATATMDKAAAHGVPEQVQPFAVAMLEVVSTAGTLLAIFGASERLRSRAMLAVAGSSAVSLVAGWSAFGWFGAVGPLSLVYLVHLAAEAYGELRVERAQRRAASEASTAPAAPVAVAVVEPLAPVEPEVVEAAAEAPAEPVGEPVAALPEWVEPVVEHLDHDRPLLLLDAVRAVVAVEPEIGDRRLVAELDLATRHQARTLLREVRTGLSAVSA